MVLNQLKNFNVLLQTTSARVFALRWSKDLTELSFEVGGNGPFQVVSEHSRTTRSLRSKSKPCISLFGSFLLGLVVGAFYPSFRVMSGKTELLTDDFKWVDIGSLITDTGMTTVNAWHGHACFRYSCWWASHN